MENIPNRPLITPLKEIWFVSMLFMNAQVCALHRFFVYCNKRARRMGKQEVTARYF
jgi:hypothetical protein